MRTLLCGKVIVMKKPQKGGPHGYYEGSSRFIYCCPTSPPSASSLPRTTSPLNPCPATSLLAPSTPIDLSRPSTHLGQPATLWEGSSSNLFRCLYTPHRHPCSAMAPFLCRSIGLAESMASVSSSMWPSSQPCPSRGYAFQETEAPGEYTPDHSLLPFGAYGTSSRYHRGSKCLLGFHPALGMDTSRPRCSMVLSNPQRANFRLQDPYPAGSNLWATHLLLGLPRQRARSALGLSPSNTGQDSIQPPISQGMGRCSLLQPSLHPLCGEFGSPADNSFQPEAASPGSSSLAGAQRALLWGQDSDRAILRCAQALLRDEWTLCDRIPASNAPCNLDLYCELDCSLGSLSVSGSSSCSLSNSCSSSSYFAGGGLVILEMVS